jgi:hypothetical protein
MSEGQFLEDRRRDFEDLRPSLREPVKEWSAERVAAEVGANVDLDQPQAAVQTAEDFSGALDEDSPLDLPMAVVA